MTDLDYPRPSEEPSVSADNYRRSYLENIFDPFIRYIETELNRTLHEDE